MLRFTISAAADAGACCRSFGLMANDAINPDDLDALIRAYGGLEGLACELGQTAPPTIMDAEEANDDAPQKHIRLWRRMIRALI